MLYLATASGPKAREAMRRGLIGQMLTYKSGNLLEPGASFAVDNGVVKLVDGRPVTDPNWSEKRWLALLDRYQGTPGCLFAAVPDVVGDAQATDERWVRYHQAVRDRGYRPAYVTQDGCRRIPDNAEALFTGGSDVWKESTPARVLARIASLRGLHCHMGRVNTKRRLALAIDHGDYDTVDGTMLAHGVDYNLKRLLRWLRELA